MSKKILSFDLGTGGNKASLFDLQGQCLASSFVGYGTEYPRSGWHEQAPEDWYKAVAESTRKLLAQSGVPGSDVSCLAVSGHSLGCVPLDKNGKLLRDKTPIWSDSRAVEEAQTFFKTFDETEWYQRTGNGFPAPHYTIFKILWYQKNAPEMFRQIDKVIGTKDYINFRLTGRAATDFSYASGSGVYRLTEWKYDDELIQNSGVDPSIFPEILPSTGIVGNLTVQAAEELGLSTETVVAAGGVDNSCMALGAGNIKPGRLYASLGSSTWIAISDDTLVLDNKTKPYTFAHVIPGMYTTALGMFSSGTTFRWIKDAFFQDLVQKAEVEHLDVYDLLTSLAAESPIGANGLLMNPSMAGGSSIDPSPKIRGGFLNLDLSHTRADVVRSVMEGVAMNMRVLLDSLRKLAKTDEKMVVVGGGSLSALWRQIYADALNIAVAKTNIGQNAASLGAAALAAVGAGLWNSFDVIDDILTIESTSEPNPESTEKYAAIFPLFEQGREKLAEFGNLVL